MTVENKLKLYRVQAGDLTQEELARKVDCSRQTIHSIESGKFHPSIELALRLAHALNVSVAELFTLKDKKK